MNWNDWTRAELQGVRDSRRWREMVVYDGSGPRGDVNGRPVISFASNDYLGLSSHPRVQAAAIAAVERFGTGATASRLMVGTRSPHLQLEAALAEWQRCESALVFSSGFAANLAALSVFGTADATIFSDELNHASIVDGCRLAKARVSIYRHNDLDHLAALLRATATRKLVVTDTVFSMDGDVAPIGELARLCTQHGALLILDEAHAVLEPVHEFAGRAVLKVGTLSKTLGALGGWIAGPRASIELLTNRARAFIYSTALSPADTAAAFAALQIVTNAEGAALRTHLVDLIRRLRPEHRSPIVPIMFGAEDAALEAAKQLLARGTYIPAIRPPSVPVNASRLRIALSAAHSVAMVETLKLQLAELPCRPTVRNN